LILISNEIGLIKFLVELEKLVSFGRGLISLAQGINVSSRRLDFRFCSSRAIAILDGGSGREKVNRCRAASEVNSSESSQQSPEAEGLDPRKSKRIKSSVENELAEEQIAKTTEAEPGQGVPDNAKREEIAGETEAGASRTEGRAQASSLEDLPRGKESREKNWEEGGGSGSDTNGITETPEEGPEAGKDELDLLDLGSGPSGKGDSWGT
jgi:hypothetical protein